MCNLLTSTQSLQITVGRCFLFSHVIIYCKIWGNEGLQFYTSLSVICTLNVWIRPTLLIWLNEREAICNMTTSHIAPTNTAHYCSLNKADVWRWQAEFARQHDWINKKWFQKSKIVLQFSVSLWDISWEGTWNCAICSSDSSVWPVCSLGRWFVKFAQNLAEVPEKMLFFPWVEKHHHSWTYAAELLEITHPCVHILVYSGELNQHLQTESRLWISVRQAWIR